MLNPSTRPHAPLRPCPSLARGVWRRVLHILLGVLLALGMSTAAAESLLRPAQLAVIVNTDDPSSMEVAEYYLRARDIPRRNLLRVSIPGSPPRLTVEQFEALKEQLEPLLRPDLEAMVLVWTTPYAVACNSITSALSLGFDAEQCADGCAAGRLSPYFDGKARGSFMIWASAPACCCRPRMWTWPSR